MTTARSNLALVLADVDRGNLQRLDEIELPPLPSVAEQVMRLTSDPRSDARALAQIVERDPGLAATVLRVVRSPLWAGTIPIMTLQQAIARLGTRSLTEVVVAASLKPAAPPGPNQQSVVRVWRHAVATASFARRVSAVRRKHVESAYLCGLLHNLGQQILFRSPEVLDVALVNQHHVLVGAAAARRWGLPDAVVAAIKHAVRWQTAPAFVDEVATVSLASRLSSDAAHPEIDGDPVLDRLNLYPEDLSNLRSQVDAVAIDVAGLT